MKELKVLSFVPLNSFLKSGATKYFEVLYKYFEVFYPDDDLPKKLNDYHKFGDKKELVFIPNTFTLIEKIEDVTLFRYKNFYIYVDKKGTIVGGLSFSLLKDIPTINATYLDNKYRGKGLGIKLYHLILNEYGKIISDAQLTPDSFSIYKYFYDKNKCHAVFVDKNKIEEIKIIELTFEKQIYEYKKDIWEITKSKVTKNNASTIYAFADHFRLMMIK